MAHFSDLVPKVASHVSGCPYPVIEDYLVRAAVEFCNRSKVYVQLLEAVSTETTTNEVPLLLPSDTMLVELLEATFDGTPLTLTTLREERKVRPKWRTESGTPDSILMMDPQTLSVSPLPSTVGTVEGTVILKPTFDAEFVEDFLYDEWGRYWSDGATAHLLVMPKKPWYDPRTATIFLASYNSGITEATSRVGNDGHMHKIRKVRYGGL